MSLDLASLLGKDRPVHIIGGGGVGMSGLALLLKNLDYQVTASDLNQSEYLQKLEKNQIQTWVGSQPGQIAKDAVVFHSTAIPEHDPERLFAKENNLPIFSRHPLLKFLTRSYFTIAVSGTHGKTTTSAFIAYALELAGLDPTALIGGKLINWQSNFRLGQKKYQGKPLLVMEADESDKSFLHIDADIAVLTNVDFDHVDQYDDVAEAQKLFYDFCASTLARGGMAMGSVECIDFLKQFKELDSLRQELEAIDTSNERCIMMQGRHYELSLPGEHNRWNATAVLMLLRHLEIDDKTISKALAEFAGVGRRMQILGDVVSAGKTVTVIDDYAHHPQEMKLVSETLNKEKKDLLVIWEPHRISRFDYFFEEFKQVIEKQIGFENLVLMPTFRSGDDEANFSNYQSKRKQVEEKARLVLANESELSKLVETLNGSDQDTNLVFMGAGHSSLWAQRFLQLLGG